MPGKPGKRSARRALVAAALITTALVTAAGCGGSDGSGPPGTASPPTASAPAPTPSQSPTPTATPSRKSGFSATVEKVTAKDLPHSWRKGCPVPPSGLRMIRMSYWGMDDRHHENGRLVVNAKAADDLVKVFRKLYGMRYPIKRMEPVDKYEGSDFDSIEANNTSAFNCRNATGGSHWSQHAYGLAIDINPCENPYVTASGHVAHKDCVKYRKRTGRTPGLIHAGDRVVKAFASIGWGWGGSWTGTKDYQHFSSTGR
ncbi:M15 family metallopeptidase [Spirillospora albida]|uniref:M15 family metallopeptidase n=1 Tax=Spirillospora albida TaxID=58123 RepID=UPI0004C04A33|nr:M15 family metallopeptidase [Spirillospora albida]